MFKPVSPNVNFPKLEEEILNFWEEKKIFEKTLEKTKNGKRFVFYEGPPTANGKPHIGHIITRIYKDIFPRFKTMQGFYVERKGGWDTHGLPVEVEVEKQLGISGKEEIENIVSGDRKASIIKFNELCKKSVWKYVELWEKMIKRIGNWIDLKDAYVTYKKEYVESVWWSLKELYKKGLLYLGYKVVPYCTRCETPLSSHEVVQEYKETEDPSIFIKFPLKDEKNVSFLVWTTTPWTLPANVALAVDQKLTYVKVKEGKEIFIIAESAVERLGFKEILGKIKGNELIEKSYIPPFPFLSEKFKGNKSLHTVLPGDFIKTDEGTGIVHVASMYGEEDFELGKKFKLPMQHLVDQKGKFLKEADDFEGLYIKDADKVIINDLLEEGIIFKIGAIVHPYPFCWRCHSPLIYYALESWFIETTKVKSQLVENNNSVNWIPKHIKNGRMRNWYETLIDWSLSRNRYWGTPLPVWVCTKCENKMVIGSLTELKQKAVSKEIDWESFDLHRPWVDEVEVICDKCKSLAKRVPYVIDVWYDSGSMPFAQYHYPFKNKDLIEGKKQFPADFISEAIDQTRGWFFSLQAVSTMLFNESSYKSVVVFDHALDEKGKKMSKHLGNVLDPWIPMEKYGADAMRWFFLTAVPLGSPYRVSTDTIGEALKRFILIYWNTYNFFVTNANSDSWKKEKSSENSADILDKWIISRLQEVIKNVTEDLEKYDTYNGGKEIEKFVIDDFSKWFVRRSRNRVGPAAEDLKNKNNAYETYWKVLVDISTLLAPFIPLTSDIVYRNLTDKESVHLSDWPVFDEKLIDEDLNKDMQSAIEIASLVNSFRKESGIKVRIPLKRVEYYGPKDLSEEIKNVILSEVNVYDFAYKGKKEKFEIVSDATESNQDLVAGEARDIIRQIQQERKKLGTRLDEKINVVLPNWPEKFEEEIKKKALIKSLTRGEKFTIKRS